ncbi:MAG: YggS family pyridoxal phosphate-dependent enzyme [Chitinophagaceae bacterium]|jgi:pyridoxal phosphate enzyme (YggS family)|nr:YggS family pyridoxal phosphate-dependent enzyme [Chitinophagaceae bacterium]
MSYLSIKEELAQHQVELVAVSKTKPIEAIQAIYDQGQRDFGENKVQEMEAKYQLLPKDIRWHLIGHLQKNKVKYIAPFVHLIHSVDSLELLFEINKQALKNNRVLDVLLQIHIAREESKFGLDKTELIEILDINESKNTGLQNIRIRGLMGMATFSDDEELIRKEFNGLKDLFTFVQQSYFLSDPSFSLLSMGMSSDYHLAIEAGSNMVRIGSLLFGNRTT